MIKSNSYWTGTTSTFDQFNSEDVGSLSEPLNVDSVSEPRILSGSYCSPDSNNLLNNILAKDSNEPTSNIVKAFKENQQIQLALFERKHQKYGASNILDGNPTDKIDVEESLFQIYVRMRDKLNRFKTMIENDDESSDESMLDTLNDLSNYANIAVIVKSGRWAD